ncbi:MAG: acylneuraminate cytidylyltransferase family protein [Planctomycetota bacterium]
MTAASTVQAVILARGGSKGLPGKNLRPLAGVPLLARGVAMLQETGICDRVLVSTDDQALADVALACGAEVPFLRPAELARDDSPSLPALEHAVRHPGGSAADTTLLYQVTSPLCRPQQVRDAVTQFNELTHEPQPRFLKSVVAVREHPHWMGTLEDGELHYLFADRAVRRQELPLCYRLNGALSLYRTAALISGTAESGRPVAFVMDETSSLDIDDEADWARAEEALRAAELS